MCIFYRFWKKTTKNGFFEKENLIYIFTSTYSQDQSFQYYYMKIGGITLWTILKLTGYLKFIVIITEKKYKFCCQAILKLGY